MHIWVPENCKSRDIKLTLKPSTLKLVVFNEVLIDGEFHKKVKPDEEVWILDSHNGKRCITMTVEKLD